MFDIQMASASMWSQIFYGFIDSKLADADLTKKQKNRLKSAWENDKIFALIAAHYMNLFYYTLGDLVCEDGEDLPEGINPRTVKMSLLMNGMFFLRNKVTQSGKTFKGLYAQPGYGMGIYNMNLDPLQGFITNLNGSEGQMIDLYVPGQKAEATQYGPDGKHTKDPSGFIIWDNPQRVPPILYALQFAYYIADSYRTLDQTRSVLKVPLIFTSPNKSLAQALNAIFESADLHETWAVEDKAFNQIDKVQMFETNANGQNLKDVTGLIQWYDAQVLKMRGIKTNSQMDKKGENLNEAEISADDMVTEINRQGPIDCKNYYLKMVRGLPGFEGCNLIWQEPNAIIEEKQEEEEEEKQEGVSNARDDNGSDPDEGQTGEV